MGYVWSPRGYFLCVPSAKHRVWNLGGWVGRDSNWAWGQATGPPALGLGAGQGRTCLARQLHLAVLRDLPLQRLLKIGTCACKTNVPTVREPGSARVPPVSRQCWGEGQLMAMDLSDAASARAGTGVRQGRCSGHKFLSFFLSLSLSLALFLSFFPFFLKGSRDIFLKTFRLTQERRLWVSE